MVQSFRVPVNANSFGQADRKEEKAAGYKRCKRVGGRLHRTGTKDLEGKTVICEEVRVV